MAQSPAASLRSRRSTLRGAATAAILAASGCMRRLRSVTGWRSRSQISLEISTVPADVDPYALRIARRIAEWFRAGGIEATVNPIEDEELLRQVLINHEYDVFVGELTSGMRNPDDLYPLLHSKYVDASGWQNPFGYANLDVDEDLERQRRVESPIREQTVTDLQSTIARTQPFTTIARHDDVRAARTSRFENWQPELLSSPMGYLALERAGDGTDDRDSTVRLASTNDRVTANLNPLSVEFRRSGLFVRLLYDSLGYVDDEGGVSPWLAAAWTFSVNESTPTATVQLRDDLTWHDGEPLTATDVAFTFSLLEDTNGGPDADDEESDPVPAPRYRGRSSLVDDVQALDANTVAFRFTECAPTVAVQALTVPILPEHVWADRRTQASVSGFEFGPATEAIVTDNVPPIGSGPLQFVRNNPRESFVLERNEDHFLTRETVTNVPAAVRGGPAFDRLELTVVGSDTTAIDLVVDDEADVTQTPVGANTVPRIGRANELELLVGPSTAPYIVGYNVRRPPLSNSRFRNTLVRLIDQAYVADQVFDGYAEPVASPLAGTPWLPEKLAWEGKHPVTPFLGDDGDLDVKAARSAFRDAGFQYEDEKLVLSN